VIRPPGRFLPVPTSIAIIPEGDVTTKAISSELTGTDTHVYPPVSARVGAVLSVVEERSCDPKVTVFHPRRADVSACLQVPSRSPQVVGADATIVAFSDPSAVLESAPHPMRMTASECTKVLFNYLLTLVWWCESTATKPARGVI
jgi:hypothetical protein